MNSRAALALNALAAASEARTQEWEVPAEELGAWPR